VNTDEFLDNYQQSLSYNAAIHGGKEAERQFVRHFSNDQLVENLKDEEDDLGGALSGLTKEEYIPIRNKVFDTAFGKGFAEQYDRHPYVGSGSYGTVFEKPGDPSRVLKVQRIDNDEERARIRQEVDTQLDAAELGIAPQIHTEETAPSSYRHNNSNTNSELHITEMDKVKILDNEPLMNRESRHEALAFAKARLQLASKGILHDDVIAFGHRRDDHLSYDPITQQMKIIDYGKVERHDHAQNLHDHSKNPTETSNVYGKPRYENNPTDRAKHFLDHKVDAIYDGMQAVGNQEEATIFYESYKGLKEKNNLEAANDLVNQGEQLIHRHGVEHIPYEGNNPTAEEYYRGRYLFNPPTFNEGKTRIAGGLRPS